MGIAISRRRLLEVVTTRQAADLLGVTHARVRQLLMQGRVKDAFRDGSITNAIRDGKDVAPWCIPVPVEILPTTTRIARWPSVCPACGAGPAKGCRTSSGAYRNDHAVRGNAV